MLNLQVRNVPAAVHRALKSKASLEGRSLSDFVLAELSRLAERPTPSELHARLRQREPVHLLPPPAIIIREQRGRGCRRLFPRG